MAVLAGSPGDSDTLAYFTGTIFGALLGFEKLYNSKLFGEPLAYQLDLIKGNLQKLFFTDIDNLVTSLASFSNEDFIIQNGERIAQLVIAKHERAKWINVEELSETSRGEGGFGSTGVK